MHTTSALLRLILAFAVIASAACVEAGTDPEVATSIEIDTIPYPSIVAGDSLRNDAGIVVPIPVQAFNSRNEPLPQAPITFIVADTAAGLVIDADGRVFADPALTPDTLPHGPVRVVAQVGQLQSTAGNTSTVVLWLLAKLPLLASGLLG